MDKNTPGKKPVKALKDREDRLKAALKANLARRKAQTKARSSDNVADKAIRQDDKG